MPSCTLSQPVSRCLLNECFCGCHHYFNTMLEPEWFWFLNSVLRAPSSTAVVDSIISIHSFLKIWGFGELLLVVFFLFFLVFFKDALTVRADLLDAGD